MRTLPYPRISAVVALVALLLTACGTNSFNTTSRHEFLLETAHKQNIENAYSKQVAIEKATGVLFDIGVSDPSQPVTSTPAEAEAVIEELDLDWAHHALITARDLVYFDFAFSEQRLKTTLAEKKFSEPQIEYALTHLEVDWAQQAKEGIEFFLQDYPDMPPNAIASFLDNYDFSDEEFAAGMERLDMSPEEHAAIVARTIMANSFAPLSRANLLEELEKGGFSPEHARAGAKELKIDWKEQALAAATEISPPHRKPGFSTIKNSLLAAGFSLEEIAYVEQVYSSYE